MGRKKNYPLQNYYSIGKKKKIVPKSMKQLNKILFFSWMYLYFNHPHLISKNTIHFECEGDTVVHFGGCTVGQIWDKNTLKEFGGSYAPTYTELANRVHTVINDHAILLKSRKFRFSGGISSF